ncbi:hypothetical protein FHS26_004802 [Rhizobium pisi]|jgi:hypothetical protein|uniref:Uncharacterized protein n=2 Tax=Rhizobium TaxID=379 RepID=A0A7W6FHD1_9HYPH|nr:MULTISPECIES: hypothetical protein [Rhizobium]MBB3137043.1 hypothetical protein [Rhizobium pisi]MBB3913852.1 hypothetical protein [Rhizobium fabae]
MHAQPSGKFCQLKLYDDLSESEQEQKFSGHALHAGLASSAKVDESATCHRFQINLTKASGL